MSAIADDMETYEEICKFLGISERKDFYDHQREILAKYGVHGTREFFESVVKPREQFPLTNVCTPERKIMLPSKRITKLFLGGTIDMGSSHDWQADIIKDLAPYPSLYIFNPRRNDWDSSWEQDVRNEQFRTQVIWEQNRIAESDVVLLHFAKGSQSPITLLEFGQFCTYAEYTQHVIVSCDATFYRRGNVEIMCELFNIPFHTDHSYALANIKTLIDKSTI